MSLKKAFCLRGAVVMTVCGLSAPLHAQREIDRADPALTERALSAPLMQKPAPSSTATSIKPSEPPAATFAGDVPVGAIVVEGARTLRAAEFARVVEAYVGRRLTAADLKALAQGVADLARDRGYVFASAWVPRQTITSGILRVRLDEGRIDEVRVSRSQGSAPDPAIARTLAALSDDRPVTRGRVERALLLAGDLPGVRIVGSTYQREGDRGVLLVESVGAGTSGNVQIDNRGSRSVGPVRLRVRADVMGAFLPGDQLSLRGTLTPLQPNELGTAGFDYALDMSANGLLAGIGASYTRVQPGRRPRDSQVEGRSTSLNANLSYPVKRTLEANLWVTADLTVRDVAQDREGVLIRADRLTTLTLGASGYRGWLGGWLYGRLSARQGLNVLDATKRGDPLASRNAGSGIFSKLEAYVDWTGPISGPLGLRIATEGQASTRALLSSEEFGIGGPRFGKAYDYSERSGDRGVAGLVELRYDIKNLPIARRTTQVYAFADAGTVGNIGPGGGGGSLYSAGAGVRFDLSKVFDAEIEAGFPIGNDRYETGNRELRLSFSMSARF